MKPKHDLLIALSLITPLFWTAHPVSAQTSILNDSASPALTIYNENFAVVRDTVPLNLAVGTNHITFTGITSQVEPDSVILQDPTGKRVLTVLEQNYRGDTVSEGLLLSLNEGKTIDFETPNPSGGSPYIVQGTIIRSGYSPPNSNENPYGNYNPYENNPDNSALIEVDGKLEFGLPGKPLFPTLGTDTILQPTLDWTIYTDKAGPLDADLAYITEGITWDAAYNVVAPETGSNLDLTAWVTIKNTSGKDFDNAKIKLMAGDVNKIQPTQPTSNYAIEGIVDQDALAPQAMATEKALDDYHLYTLPNKTTLRNNETKQVQFLHVGGIASKEVYIYDGLKLDQNQSYQWANGNNRDQSDFGTESNPKVTIQRDFVNSKANGLGVPLPAGRVRFYRLDADGQLEFLGEDNIDHTPQDETVKITTGNAFDIVGNRTQTSYAIDNEHQTLDESFAITLTNHKSTPVDVTILEHLYRGDTWTITAHSDDFDKIDSSTIEFPVTVPAGGNKLVTYSAHYTW